MSYLSGQEIAQHFPEELDEEQIQPAGIDLTIDQLFVPDGDCRISTDGKTIAERTEVPTGTDARPEEDVFLLSEGSYIIQYGETISIPENGVGFVYPRSSVMRNNATIDTAVWDPGYTGKGEGRLEVHHPIYIEPNARIAQLVVSEVDAQETYDGTYQHENLEE